jgi:hypothetical protein
MHAQPAERNREIAANPKNPQPITHNRYPNPHFAHSQIASSLQLTKQCVLLAAGSSLAPHFLHPAQSSWFRSLFVFAIPPIWLEMPRNSNVRRILQKPWGAPCTHGVPAGHNRQPRIHRSHPPPETAIHNPWRIQIGFVKPQPSRGGFAFDSHSPIPRTGGKMPCKDNARTILQNTEGVPHTLTA